MWLICCSALLWSLRMGTMPRPKLLLLLVLCVLGTDAVDRSNFKTCDQSSFCKRHRNLQPGMSPYRALMDTVQMTPEGLSMKVLNTRNKVELQLLLAAVNVNTARLTIDEVNPIRERFRPTDALSKEPTIAEASILAQDDNSVTLGFLQNKAVVTSDPFRIDFLVDDELAISVNSRGLMKFEQYRKRKNNDEPAEGQENEENQDGEKQEGEGEEEKPVEEEDEPGMWEETFKSHHDSKPHGPSSVGLDFSFPGVEHVYGIPEHADSFALKTTTSGEPYRLYNLDVFEYELHNPMALYGSIPVMIAHNAQRTVGLFWMNAAETWIDISSNTAGKTVFGKMLDYVKGGSEMPQTDTHWISESGVIDVFFMLGPRPAEVFSQYTDLTGKPAMPPLFAIAYHQSRWNYNDEEDVKNVDAGFDDNDIPYDVLWLDIEHTDGKRYMTWDKHKFPHPIDMQDRVAAKGRKMVVIVDPHIKRDDNYHIHKDAKDHGYYVKSKDGGDFEGWCWPGSSSYLDFINPTVRSWWASRFELGTFEGSTKNLFIWNDMNEPSVFNGPEVTMHKDAVHYGGWEHRDVHNIFGMYLPKSTYLGLMQRSNNKERPFVLSRAFFAGYHRYGAVWTGDNTAEWGHLQISIPMLLSLSVTGQSFVGADVGGFFKNPDPELLLRWYQAAAYQPFFRAHAHLDTRRREPWLFDKETMNGIREAIRARYALLPYWYTLFYQAATHGMPIMRPLWVEFPEDTSTFATEDEYMIGNALLAHPVTDAGASGVQVHLPGEGQVWYDVDTYKKYNGGSTEYIPVTLTKIPVFQRGGTIVPRKERIRRASSLTNRDPYTFTIALDKQGTATGELFVDDGHSFKYRDNNRFLHKNYLFENNKLISRTMDMNGEFDTKSWVERIIIIGLPKAPTTVTIDGIRDIMIDKKNLEFRYTPDTQTLVIRKPAVNVAQNWSITLQ
ncbi:neutral alpha-glucosidase AB-like isoform X1 [Branchiostoma floridae]|uniref:Neutral alpha-glucosidase AB n=2 Tax=Branchiostoma floridae TaxID=7739 RepID=A0A9J7M8K5_BRAFL|nr:neutral alpha-glucosidase AB-like isoform X1 [Branchiostoma floridae]